MQRPAATPELRQLAAKLHVHFGIPVDQERASPPVLSPRATTGPSYQVSHAGRGREPEQDEDQITGHFLRSKVRIVTPANFVARAKVYDLREYSMNSLWGPFKGDGSLEVDWEKIEAIMVLMGHNLRLWTRSVKPGNALWYGPWEGLNPGSFLSRHEEAAQETPDNAVEPDYQDDNRSPEEIKRDEAQAELDKQDPYGITGSWLRVVCFLDYNDLYAFNFTNDRRHTDRQRGIATDEAIRLICVKIQVTRIVYPGKKGHKSEDSDSSSDYDDDDVLLRTRAQPSGFDELRGDEPQDSPMQSVKQPHQKATNPYADWPIVYFTGTSRSIHSSWDPNANSRIRGTVRMTRHGDVRWTTWSIFHGEERWRSEGVQIGGPKSRRGVLGNWFDKFVSYFSKASIRRLTQSCRDYNHYGPAGPTAFWKVSNNVDYVDSSENPAPMTRLRHDLLHYLLRGASTSDDEDEDDGDQDGNEGNFDESDSDDDLDDNGDENTQVSVEIVDERLDGVEFEIVDVNQALLDELEDLRRENESAGS
ncbi:hypothetical protein ANO11243_045190 [Dothideomycetidae sp. 11243]|nr:hypothetical protein ANO11243_045190 [fungal sp. No.11243]